MPTRVVHSLRTCSLRAVQRYGRPCRAAQHYTTICMQPYYIRNMLHTLMVTMMVNERKERWANFGKVGDPCY